MKIKRLPLNTLVNWLPSLELMRVAWRFQEKMTLNLLYLAFLVGQGSPRLLAHRLMPWWVLTQDDPHRCAVTPTWPGSNRTEDNRWRLFCLLIHLPTFDQGGNLSDNQELLNSNLSNWWGILSYTSISLPPIKIRNVCFPPVVKCFLFKTPRATLVLHPNLLPLKMKPNKNLSSQVAQIYQTQSIKLDKSLRTALAWFLSKGGRVECHFPTPNMEPFWKCPSAF